MTGSVRAGVLLNAEHEHQRLIAYARRAEELGFQTLWYADERFYREPYVGLAACALATSRIRLGPAVTDPYTRHPALTAAAIASLDELSGGRAVLGYWAGLSGFHNLGIQLQTVLDAGIGEVMAYLLVPQGETMEDVMRLFGQAVASTSNGDTR